MIDWTKRAGNNTCDKCKCEVRVGLRKKIASNGAIAVFQVCLRSNPPHRLKSDGVNISHDAAQRLGFKIEDIPVMEEATGSLFIDCVVFGCGNPGAEDHHTSPTCVFGDEADNWPRILLCVKHHNEWHERMMGYHDAMKRKGDLRHVSEVAEQTGIAAKVNQ